MANLTARPQLSFMEAVKTCFKKYATFSGRARRSEFWWFQVLNWILYTAMYALVAWKMSVKADIESQVAGALFDEDKMNALMAQAESFDSTWMIFLCIIGIIGLFLLLPALGVLVRRLHDIGKKGWIILLTLIPLVNIVVGLIIFIWTLKDSDPATNQFGPSPKYVSDEV